MGTKEMDALLAQATQCMAQSFGTTEAGWMLFRATLVPAGTSDADIDQQRGAFLTGAEFIYCTIANLLDCDDREHALATLNRLQAEMLHIRDELRLRYGPTAGSG